MEDIKFSIAIPAFKSKYLEEAILSCTKQTYGNLEVVIVDDNSPEDLLGIIKKIPDARIRYYRNEVNCGAVNVVDNWNICLNYCTGDYIICMGDDDRLTPNCLNAYYNLIKKYPDIGAVHGWTEIIDENSEFLEITAPRPERESIYSLIWNRWENRHRQYIGDWCFDITYLRKKGGFYKLPLAWESDDISAIICASKNGVANTQEITFQYRRNRYTISSNGDITTKMEAKMLANKWYEDFLLQEPSDFLDYKYWAMLCSMRQKHHDKECVQLIAYALANNPFRIFKIAKDKRKYGYSTSAIFEAIHMSIKIYIYSHKRTF